MVDAICAPLRLVVCVIALIFRFLGVIFDVDHDFEGPRSPNAHLDTVLRNLSRHLGTPRTPLPLSVFAFFDWDHARCGLRTLDLATRRYPGTRTRATSRVKLSCGRSIFRRARKTAHIKGSGRVVEHIYCVLRVYTHSLIFRATLPRAHAATAAVGWAYLTQRRSNTRIPAAQSSSWVWCLRKANARVRRGQYTYSLGGGRAR